MGRQIIGVCLVVLDAGALRGKIVGQRSAEIDVDDLYAAADAEYRDPVRERVVEERVLEVIELLRGRAGLLGRLSAEELRIDVLSACDENAVEARCHVLVENRINHDRASAAFLDEIEIAGKHPETLSLRIDKRCSSNKRFHN